MDLFRSGLKGFSIGGFKLDENTANLVANFASGGGLSNAFDQISRTISPNPRKAPPRPPPIGSFKVVNSEWNLFILLNNIICYRVLFDWQEIYGGRDKKRAGYCATNYGSDKALHMAHWA